jgi:hypothetical protein
MKTSKLLFVFVVAVGVGTNLEVLDGVGGLVGRHDTQPVAQLVLLEVLLGQVLQVALGDGKVGRAKRQLVAVAGDADFTFGQVVGAAIHLDAIAQVLLLRRV